MYIFRTYITAKDGTKIYAKAYGKKAFRFWVGPGPEPSNKQRFNQFKAYLLTNMLSLEIKKGGVYMAKTKSSSRGIQHKKIVPVKGYKKNDGTQVKSHRRSTPN